MGQGWLSRVAGLMVLAVVGAVVVAIPASAAKQPVPVFLEFDGSGTFAATNGVHTGGPSHAGDNLSWKVIYKGTLNPDGSIVFQPALGSAEGGPAAAACLKQAGVNVK